MILSLPYLFLHAFFAHFVYLSLSITLVVTLLSFGLSIESIALVLTAFIWSYRGGRVLLAPLTKKITAPVNISFGCYLAFLGFLVAGFADSLLLITLAVIIIGTGMSVNMQATKELIALNNAQYLRRQKRFAMYNIATNVAAIPTPFIAFLLLELRGQLALYLFLGLIFLIMGLFSYGTLPSRTTIQVPATEKLITHDWLLLKEKTLTHALLINSFGWFFRGLLLTLVPFYFFGFLHQMLLIKWALFFKSTVMVLLQIPITRWIRSNLHVQHFNIITWAYFGFALSFLFLSIQDSYVGITTFLLIYAIAEMLFLPSMEARWVELAKNHRPASLYSLVSLSTAIGEWLGCMIFLKAHATLQATASMVLIWPALTLLGFILAICAVRILRRSTG